ncbi:MAG: hypothetical protein PVG20_05150 [Thioalkalispiraceae bacterium]|jgi:hypothetical protein
MSLFTQSISIPVWLFILLMLAMIPLLYMVFMLIYQFMRGDIVKEEHSDMVVWKFSSPRRSAAPKKKSADITKEKEREKKSDLVQVLKILLKEGEKGVLMQTIADRMGTNISKTQHAMQILVEKQMVDEVVGVSGIKYYLTQAGRDYCQRKAK